MVAAATAVLKTIDLSNTSEIAIVSDPFQSEARFSREASHQILTASINRALSMSGRDGLFPDAGKKMFGTK
jgi:hypothetical protein